MRNRVAAFALGALVLFPAAVLLPIIEIEKLGHHHHTSLLGGITELFRNGEWAIGFIVLLFSLVFPITKLVALLELTWVCRLKQGHRALTYRLMEHSGKWSMMDVLLLAIMVMSVKLSNLVEFQFGPAILAFAAVVMLSMFASLSFDPHAIWEDS